MTESPLKQRSITSEVSRITVATYITCKGSTIWIYGTLSNTSKKVYISIWNFTQSIYTNINWLLLIINIVVSTLMPTAPIKNYSIISLQTVSWDGYKERHITGVWSSDMQLEWPCHRSMGQRGRTLQQYVPCAIAMLLTEVSWMVKDTNIHTEELNMYLNVYNRRSQMYYVFTQFLLVQEEGNNFTIAICMKYVWCSPAVLTEGGGSWNHD